MNIHNYCETVCIFSAVNTFIDNRRIQKPRRKMDCPVHIEIKINTGYVCTQSMFLYGTLADIHDSYSRIYNKT